MGRTSTVLIPYSFWSNWSSSLNKEQFFEKGFIALISPTEYFYNENIQSELAEKGLVLGENALVFYETRDQWNSNNPINLNWKAAQNRVNPLDGEYVARISATTATENGEKIIYGFNTTKRKGAGIRVYEYASTENIKKCRIQLEVLVWFCFDSEVVAKSNGMPECDVITRKKEIIKQCLNQGLLDLNKLIDARVINKNSKTICPLCLEELSAQGFFNRMQQAEGRKAVGLTITQLNLFHIEELKSGYFNHRPYNLGWGHHHCNVVVKDSGIKETIEWMATILQRNVDEVINRTGIIYMDDLSLAAGLFFHQPTQIMQEFIANGVQEHINALKFTAPSFAAAIQNRYNDIQNKNYEIQRLKDMM